MCGGRGLALRGDGERIGEGGEAKRCQNKVSKYFPKGLGEGEGNGEGGCQKALSKYFSKPVSGGLTG